MTEMPWWAWPVIVVVGTTLALIGYAFALLMKVIVEHLINLLFRGIERVVTGVSASAHHLPYALPLAGSFTAFWWAFDDNGRYLFTHGQWRLLGWTLLILGGAMLWRARASNRA